MSKSPPIKRHHDEEGKEDGESVSDLELALQGAEASVQRYRTQRDNAIEEKKATEDNYNRAISEAESERDAARQLANQANANRDAAIQAANQAGRERDVAIQAANQATANGNAAAQAALQAIRERDAAQEETKNMAGRLAVTEASLNETQAGLERAQEEDRNHEGCCDEDTESKKRRRRQENFPHGQMRRCHCNDARFGESLGRRRGSDQDVC